MRSTFTTVIYPIQSYLWRQIVLICLLLIVTLSGYRLQAQPGLPPGLCEINTLHFEGGSGSTQTNIPDFNYASGTVEAWIKKEQWATGRDEIIFSNGLGFLESNSFYFSFHPTVGIHFRYGGVSQSGNAAAYPGLFSLTNLTPNTWHHFAAAWHYNGSIMTIAIYMDGTFVAMNSASLLITDGPTAFGIGKGLPNVFFNMHDAEISDFRVWNTAKDASAISAGMYTPPVGDEEGLIAYWPLNEMPGSTEASNAVEDGEALTLENMDANTAWKAYRPITLSAELAGETINYITALDFGSKVAESDPSEAVFTITNNSANEISLGEGLGLLDINGTNAEDFTYDLTETIFFIEPGSSTTFSLLFDPSTAGEKQAGLTVSIPEGCSNPFSVSLSGTAFSTEIAYSGEGFIETNQNDGSVEGSIIATITGDWFDNSDEDGLLEIGTELILYNIPDGLTATADIIDDNQVEITLSGIATAHQEADIVEDITFEFNDAAFTNSLASEVLGATGPASSGLGITFLDNAENDDCANATALTVYDPGSGTATEGNTAMGAISDDLLECSEVSNYRDVWYNFNSGESGQVVITPSLGTAGSISGAIYTACGEILRTSDGFSEAFDPVCFNNLTDKTFIPLASNTDFLIQIWSEAEQEGTFSILLEKNLPPVVLEPEVLAYDEGTEISFTVEYEDDFIPGEFVQLGLNEEALNVGMNLNGETGEFTWNPSETDDGEYEITITAIDYIDFFSNVFSISGTTFTLTINEVNEAPVVESIPDFNLDEENHTLNVTVQASDNDDPVQELSYALDEASLNTGFNISTSGDINWTPEPVHYGTTRTVTVTVSDGVDESTATFDVAVAKGNQEIWVENNSYEAVFGDDDFQIEITPGESGELVTLSYSVENVVSIEDGMVTILGAGSTTVTLSQDGNDNYNPAPDVEITFEIDKANQEIISEENSFQGTFGDEGFVISLTPGASGQPLTFSYSNEDVVFIEDGVATILGAGTATVTVSQAGNANYNPASDIYLYFDVNKAEQFIELANESFIPDKTFGDEPFEIIVTGGASGNPVVFSSSSSAIEINGNQITIVGTGSVDIILTQAGNDNYEAAESEISFSVNSALQTISFDELEGKVYGSEPFELMATGGGSGNPVTFSSSNSSVLEITGNIATIRGAGSVIIYASQEGNSNYNEADQVSQSMTVSPMPLNVQADNKEKYFCEEDPELTYRIISGTLVGEDYLFGSLQRESGDVADTYEIGRGNLSGGENYTIDFESGEFVIKGRPVTLSAFVDEQFYSNVEDLDFGTMLVGASPVEATFTLANTSQDFISLGEGLGLISIIGDHEFDFTVDMSNMTFGLEPGASTTFTVTFDPEEAGNRAATLSLSLGEACYELYEVSLQGAGQASIAYSGSGFVETNQNDGSVEGSIIATITGDWFDNSDEDGLLEIGTELILYNIPDGLTATADIIDDNQVEITLSGIATAHQEADIVEDITFEFTDAAFTNSLASEVLGATGPASSGLGITFLDNAENDDCANATALTVYNPGSGTATEGNTAMGAISDDLLECSEVSNYRDVWYSFNSGESGQVVIKPTIGSASSISGAIYTDCGELAIIFEEFPACLTSTSEPLFAPLEPNTDYLIRVWSGIEGEGTFSILLEENLPSVILEPEVLEFNEGEEISFTIEYEDDFIFRGIDLSLDTESQNLGMSLNSETGEFSWTPGELEDGEYEITITATDSDDFLGYTASTSSTTFTLTINEVNEAPVVESIPDFNLDEENHTLNVTVQASDNDDPVQELSYALDEASLNTGFNISTSGDINWTPEPVHYGTTRTVTVTVSDGVDESTATFDVAVAKGNQEIWVENNSYEAVFGDDDFQIEITPGESGELVTLSYSVENVVSIEDGMVTILGAGSTTVTLSQDGNDNYNPAPDVQLTFVIDKANQEIISEENSFQGTFGDEGFVVSLTPGASGQPLTFSYSNEDVVFIEDGVATILGAGTATVTVSQAGNANYNPASDINLYFDVNKAEQFIELANESFIPDKTFGDEPFEIIVTGGASGNPVVFSSSSSAIEINGNQITIVGTGSVDIILTQAGNDNYEAAESEISFSVNSALQTISFDELEGKVYGSEPFELMATGGGSGNPVTFSSSNSSVLEITGNIATIRGAGSVIIYASQEGNSNYNEADQVSQSMTVSPMPLNVQADNKEKYFCEEDPELTYRIISGTLVGEDYLFGSLQRESGDVADTYEIGRGDLSGGENYTIDFESGEFVIKGRPVTLSAFLNEQFYSNVEDLDFGTMLVGASPVEATFTLANTSQDFISLGEGMGLISIIGDHEFDFTVDMSNMTFGLEPGASTTFTVTFDPEEAGNRAATLSLSLGEACYELYEVSLQGAGQASIAYSGSGFVETNQNDGSVEGSIIATITGDLFDNSDEDGQLEIGTELILYNIPDGLTATADIIDDNQVEITLSGIATAHQEADIVEDITFEFTDAAFTNSLASEVLGATGPASSGLGILFEDTPGQNCHSAIAIEPYNGLPSESAEPIIVGSTIDMGFKQNEIACLGENQLAVRDVWYSVNSGPTGIIWISREVFEQELILGLALYADCGESEVSQITDLFNGENVPGCFPSLSDIFIVGSRLPIALTPNTDYKIQFFSPQENTGNFSFNLWYHLPPDVEAVSAQEINEKETLSIPLNVTGDAVDMEFSIEYSLDESSVSLGMEISEEGVITWTPTEEQDGSYEVTVSVTDYLTTTEITFDLTVNEVNESPVVEAIDDQVVDHNATFTYQIVASDADVPEQDVTYHLDGESLGKGMTINEETGLFSWLPGLTYAGTSNHVEVTVSDGQDASFVTFNIQVNKADQTIVFEAIDEKTYGDQSFDLAATGGESGNAISFTSSDQAVATIIDNTVTIVGVGTTTITASQAGNETYNAAEASRTLTVIQRNITITADHVERPYGDEDPELTYKITEGSLVEGDELAGAPERVQGEDVDTYAIEQGTLTAGDNYAINFITADFRITPRIISVIALDAEKIYGDDDPVLEYEYDESLLVEDEHQFTGLLSRDEGIDVGLYSIEQGSLSINSTNYEIDFQSGTFEILRRVITIVGLSESKVYGHPDPELEIDVEGTLYYEDELNGTISREPGENVGIYAITQGTLDINDNYTIDFEGGEFRIIPFTVEVTVHRQYKVYGEDDPELTYDVSETLPFEDAFTGSLERQEGEDVGSYPIGIGSLAINDNYEIEFTGESLYIEQREIEITADNLEKVYGDDDPELTYSLSSSLAFDDEITGSLERQEGEDVGDYSIERGSITITRGEGELSVIENYEFNFQEGNFDIRERKLTIRADDKSKVYGDEDPTLTYTIVSGSLAPGESFEGSMYISYDDDQSVGTYSIEEGGFRPSGGYDNYDYRFEEGDFEITARPITISVDAQQKVYGEEDPELTFSLSEGGLASFDQVNGSLERESGEDVGEYEISLGQLELGSDNENYAITFNSSVLEITAREISITAESSEKVYGDQDPQFNYTVSGEPANWDYFNGSLGRTGTEDVGIYTINLGDLTISGSYNGIDNYDVTFNEAAFTITARPITIVANQVSKMYGDEDPELTYELNGNLYFEEDEFTGALAREEGETVGDYNIEQGSLSLGNNYTISFEPSIFSIKQREVTITANTQNKVYGEDDPILTYTISPGLYFEDEVSGELIRVEGEDVGDYPIEQGTLQLNENYQINFNGADLIIASRALTLTADDKQKVYGDEDPELTYKITEGSLVEGDELAGAPERVQGEDVDTYAIEQGTLTAGDNYVINFITANLSIARRPIAIVADNLEKTYGTQDPQLTYQITEGNMVEGDVITGNLSRSEGETVGPYEIGIGTLSVSENYSLSFSTGQFTINPQTLTITAEANTKTYGNDDPTLVYSITNGELVFGDQLSGNLARETGENVGTYAITQGSLTASENYLINFIGADFEISKRPLNVVADQLVKTYGAEDPEFTYQIVESDLVANDALSGALTRSTGESVGIYAIQKGTLGAGNNYELNFTNGSLSIEKAPLTFTALNQSRLQGTDNPTLEFTVAGFQFEDSENDIQLPQISTTATRSSEPGSYPIVLAGGAADNYEIILVDGILSVTKRAQSIDFERISNAVFGDVIALNATASSGLEVYYSVVVGPARITGPLNDRVEFTGTGIVILAANQDGNLNFNAAREEITVLVGKATQVLTIDEMPELLTSLPGFEFTPSVNSDLPLTIEVGGEASYSETEGIFLTGLPGEVTITVTQEGNANWLPLEESFTYTVIDDRVSQTLSLNLPDVIRYGDVISLNAVATSGLQPEYELLSGDATLVGNSLTINSLNEITLRVLQPGDLTYMPAESQAFTIQPQKALLTIATEDYQRDYGDDNPELEIIYNGFVFNHNAEMLSELPVATLEALPESLPGLYDIVLSEVSSALYEIQYQPGVLEIEKATLTVSTANVSRAVGDDNPEHEILIEGFKLADGVADLEVLPMFINNTTVATPIGNYELEFVPGISAKYDFDFIPSTVDVVGKEVTITVTDADGAPISGIMVELIGMDFNPIILQTAITDENGRSIFNNVDVGNLTIKASPEEVLRSQYFNTFLGDEIVLPNATMFNLAATQATDYTISLQDKVFGTSQGPIDVTGTLNSELQGGDPMSNTVIYLVNESGEVVREEITDQEGEFNFENIAPGDYSIWIEHDDILLNFDLSVLEVTNRSREMSIRTVIGTDGSVSNIILIVTGLESFASDYFEIYPTPADHFINVINNGEAIEEIALVTLDGRIIQRLEPIAADQYDVSLIKAGVYLLRIQNASQEVFFRKIIIK